MTLKKEVIQRAADLLKRFHPETPIVALTDPEHGDVDDLGITAGELCGAMEAFTRPAFIIEGNPSSADDIATLMGAAAKLTDDKARGHIFPAPTMIQWLLNDERGQPEPDFWTSHNNMENLRLATGMALNKGDVVWDFALQTWAIADTPLYTAPPRTASSEGLRIALQRISELTPASANARDARDMQLTVKAIADVALEAERNGSASSSSGGGNEWKDADHG